MVNLILKKIIRFQNKKFYILYIILHNILQKKMTNVGFDPTSLEWKSKMFPIHQLARVN